MFEKLFRISTILFLLALCIPLLATDLPVQFDHLTRADGLSQSSVYAILEDNQGYMWFGTRLGLNRYDGHEFKIFSYNPRDENSLPGYHVSALCEDKDGDLWVGTTSGGLSRYNSSLENFINFKHNPDNSNTLPNNSVTKLLLDSRGTLWIGTVNGLSNYSKSTNTFINFYHDPDDLNTLRQSRISSLVEFPPGTLCVGTENGSLSKIDLDNYTVETILEGDLSTSVNLKCMIVDTVGNSLYIGRFGEGIFRYNYEIDEFNYCAAETRALRITLRGSVAFAQDKKGVLWISTVDGLVNYDPISEKFKLFPHDRNDPSSPGDDLLITNYVDRQGILWTGTESSGIDIYDPGLIRFRHKTNQIDNINSIRSDMVFSISEDSKNNIWFGTIPLGVSVMDTKTGIFTHYGVKQGHNKGWNTNYASRVRSGQANTIYIGTFQCGFFTLDSPTQTFSHYRNMESDPDSFSDKTTKDILITRDKSVWIATETQGLEKFDKVTGTFEHFRNDSDNPNSINSDFTYCLLEDESGFIWIGTADKGLNRFDRNTGIFSHYESASPGDSSVTSDCVTSLFEDSENNLWIGTRNGGLNKMNPQRSSISRFNLNFESGNLTIQGILQDDHNYLWLSTNQGILKVHPDSGLINSYTASDGVQEGFYFSSCLKASDGQMYFGGNDGYNVFHPDSIKNNPYIPPVVLTGLSVNYEEVLIGQNINGQIILKQAINHTDELRLTYWDKVIRFKFAALNFSASYKNQYAYKMEGYDKDWIAAGTENTAQYMNLPAGDYLFRVRGSNNDGIWNLTGSSVQVIIAPPFWKTMWFKVLSIIGLLGSIIFYIHLRTSNLIAQRIKLEALVRERTEQLKTETEERQQVELEKTQQKMDHLKRELLTQTLHLNDKQQIMDNLQEELLSLSEMKQAEVKPRINKLLRFLKDRSTVTQGWEEFELWFTEVHTGFYSELRLAYPELTESELKVCALLKLNLISKDIAKVMSVQPASIDIYRHRIRKKMNLVSEDNLSTFLAQF